MHELSVLRVPPKAINALVTLTLLSRSSENIRIAFTHLARNNIVDHRSFRPILRVLWKRMADDVFNKKYTRADRDGSGALDYEDFELLILSGPPLGY